MHLKFTVEIEEDDFDFDIDLDNLPTSIGNRYLALKNFEISEPENEQADPADPEMTTGSVSGQITDNLLNHFAKKDEGR